jgi:hypothetical protein
MMHGSIGGGRDLNRNKQSAYHGTMSLATIPSDVLPKILFPDAPFREATAEMSLHRMIDLHVWRRHAQVVMSDLRRLRFFAYTGPVLRSATPHGRARDELQDPIPFWSYHQPTHLYCRCDID